LGIPTIETQKYAALREYLPGVLAKSSSSQRRFQFFPLQQQI